MHIKTKGSQDYYCFVVKLIEKLNNQYVFQGMLKPVDNFPITSMCNDNILNCSNVKPYYTNECQVVMKEK